MSDTEPTTARTAKADAKAAKARAKSLRPWFKKKRFILPLGLVALIAIISLTSGGGDDNEDSTDVAAVADPTTTVAEGEDPGTTTAETTATTEVRDPEDTKRNDLYPDRPGKEDDDHEAELGAGVRMSGYTATVTGAERKTDNEFIGKQVVIDVTLENRDDEAQSYSMFDFELQTPAGQVVDASFFSGDGGLSSGDLIEGGTVSGEVAFDVDEPGTYYVIYKPSWDFTDDRGIWQINV